MKPHEISVVTVTEGKLGGIKQKECVSFLGVPFAAPPVGELRWRSPHPPAHWEGTRLATRLSPASWQSLEYCQTIGGGDPGQFSEDCLYLNIWTSSVDNGDALPVMVWVHGGGFTIGSGGLPPYDGHAFARRGVVLVTINYRLGHLGFFAHPALDEENSDTPVYNFGLLDQIAALKWIRKNIHAFGGDAEKITLFGESAGAQSVLSLLASPLTNGLFHKAIVQIAYTLPDIPRGKALDQGVMLANHFGLKNASMNELRALPEDAFWSLETPLTIGPTPIVGDSVLPESMLDIFLPVNNTQCR